MAGLWLARNYVINDQTQTITLTGCNMKGSQLRRWGYPGIYLEISKAIDDLEGFEFTLAI